MFRKSLFFLLLCVVLGISVSAVAAQSGDLGSEANPIEVYFVPSVEAGIITKGGEVMADALKKATGLNFKVSVPTSYAATVEAMCAAPDKSIGFIPAAGYVIANKRCGVEVAAAAVRNGWSVYWTAYIVRRDSDIYTFGDLKGKKWGYPDAASTSGYIAPLVELKAAGIEPGEGVATGGHNQTVLAVYNGDVDFGTTFYSPPLMPEGHAAWQIGDLPEPYDLSVSEPSVVKNGDKTALFVGGLQILDARANVRDTAPDVIQKVRILRLSAPIPNDTLSFGPQFPADIRQKIMDALFAFAKTDEWKTSIGSNDFYGWSGIEAITDAAYEPVRQRFDILGLTEEDIFNPKKS
jgi:phosphonate transport system substrate-binding protein